MLRVSRAMLLASTGICALAASALGGSAAHAATQTACNVGAIEGLGINGVTIVTATPVAASAPNPAYCDVIGTLSTSGEGAPPGNAGFEIRLPATTWNGKFLFFGVGGLAGSTYADLATNYTDYLEALGKGYATAITDTGHSAGGTDASFALLRPGVPDRAKLDDYYYRATHEVTVAGKQLVEEFYGKSINYAYFDGCSNGGHQAMAEAANFPNDYDGVISGAPFFDARVVIASDRVNKQLLHSVSTFLLPSQLPAVDAAILESCDAADGVKDGLIQNPAACNFDAHSLICKGGESGTCLTPGQADTLQDYFSAVRDKGGNVIYNGWSVSDLVGGLDTWTLGTVPPSQIDFNSPEPWGNDGFSPATIAWQFADHILKDMYARDPNYDIRTFPVSLAGIVDDTTLRTFDERLDDHDDARPLTGFPRSAHDYDRFLATGNKLLIWQGLSDQALPPFRTMGLYKRMASRAGSYAELKQAARLFLAPGVHHCGGGPGPNVFDTLTAMEKWVEHGVAPTAILATKFNNDIPADGVARTMPLCPFPAEAVYSGHGTVTDASNWSCTDNQKMLEVGTSGSAGGLGTPGSD